MMQNRFRGKGEKPKIKKKLFSHAIVMPQNHQQHLSFQFLTTKA
jgi:hypothetical protein